jgi:hypothetical protein
MMVGISMAIAIAISIGGFIWLYIQIGPLLSDFIPQQSAPEEPAPGSSGFIIQPRETPSPTPEELTPTPDIDQATPTPDVTTPATVPTPTPTPTPEPEPEWQPTHQIRPGPAVNFRTGPNTISPPHGALPPGTSLRFLDETAPAGGVTWMYFENEEGLEGWIRDIDIMEYEGDGD